MDGGAAVVSNFEVLKKRRTKLRKFLLRTLLFLLLVTGLTAVLLRSRTVQTLLAKKAATWLSKEIGATVTVDAIDFDFFQNLHVEGLYISDQKGDTMIATKVLDVQYRKYDGTNHRIDFYSAEFNQANVHIGFHKGAKKQNIQFLIDYINGPKKPRKGPPKIWTLYFDKASFKNTRFVDFDEAKMKTEVGLLDERNLQFNNINAELRKLWVVDDSFHFEMKKFNAKERSGLEIKNMKSICNVHFKGIDLDKLEITTACSHLTGDLHFKYPGYKYLDEFISNTDWKGQLNQSEICLADLAIFDRTFVGHPEKLDIRHLNIGGTFDHLRLYNADVRMGRETHIRGDFYMEGLPDWRTTFCDFNIVELNTNAEELKRLLYGTELPQMLYDAGKMEASGHFTGQFLDFNWNGNLNSAFGNLQTDIVLNIKKGLKNGEISGHLSSPSFDLGIINENLGVSGFDLDLDGAGLDAETFSMNLKTTIPEFIIRGKEFANADIDGVLTAKNFSGKAVFNDPRLNTHFDGIIDFTGTKPVFDFTADLRGLDLMALNLDTTHTLVWGNYKVNAEGINADDILGEIEMRNVAIQRNKKVYQFAYQKAKKTGLKEQMAIQLNGDFVTGSIAGRLSLQNIDAVAINSFANIFPDRIKTIPYEGNDSFSFDLRIPETDLITAFIDPALKTGVLNFNGKYQKSNGTGLFNLLPTSITYGNYKFTDLDVNTKLHPDSGLDFRISASGMLNENRPQFLNLNAQGRALDGTADYHLDLTDRTGDYIVNLIARSEVFKDSITLLPANSKLTLANEIWYVTDESQLTILNNGRILCNDLYLDGKDHFVQAVGVISDRKSDTLSVDFGNFRFDNIRPFLAGSALDSMEGKMNGNVRISSILGSPHFMGEIAGRDLRYSGQDFGDANLALIDQNSSGRLSANCEFVRGLLAGVTVEGSIGYTVKPGMEQLALLIDIPDNTSLKAIQPFLQGILTIRQGYVKGSFNIKGNLDDPRVEGMSEITNGKITVDYLNTTYYINGRFASGKKGFYTPENMVVRDESGPGKAVLSMLITHKKFDKFYMDLKLDSANNLKVLNTTRRNNDLYYGSTWADGNCHIFGPFDAISMDINLKNRKNSKISLLYTDVEQNDIMGFVKFVKSSDSVVKEKKVTNSVINRIDIGLVVDQDLEAEFVIDKQLGDIIKGRGNGVLRMAYDEGGNFFLYGTYVINSGDYVFSLPGINVLTRKIELKQGGTITWAGDPFDAILNITGSFEKKISPAALMASTTTGTQKTYAPIKIESNLYMRGNLFSPDISFDIQAPDLESSGGGAMNDVYRVIQRIRADKDETMRQAVALLLFGNFISPSFAQSTSTNSVISGSGVAGNSLSVIASSVVNDIFARLGIPTRIQVNIDNVGNATGNTATKVFINSEWFLSERIRLDLNYDPTFGVALSNGSSATILPLNFNLEYMTRNENWRLKAFSRSNNLLSQGTNITQTVSGYTLGVGVIYRREFDTFHPQKKTADTAKAPPPPPVKIMPKDSVL